MNRRNMIKYVGAGVGTISVLSLVVLVSEENKVTALYLVGGPNSHEKLRWAGKDGDMLYIPVGRSLGRHGHARYVIHSNPAGFSIGTFSGIHSA